MTNNNRFTEIFRTEEIIETRDTLIAATIVMRKTQVLELYQQEEVQDFIIDYVLKACYSEHNCC